MFTTRSHISKAGNMGEYLYNLVVIRDTFMELQAWLSHVWYSELLTLV